MNSLFFFPIVLLILSCYNYLGRKYRISVLNIFILVSSIIFIFILGTRINFGIDHIEYARMYFKQGASLERCEWLWVLINKLFLRMQMPYQVFFSFSVFLQLVFIIKACKELDINYFFAFIIFYLIYIFQYVNIIRQCIAVSIIFLSCAYYIKRHFGKWLFLVVIASGFHISAIFSFFIAPFFYFMKNKSIRYYFFYYFILLIIFFTSDYLYDITILLLKKIILIFGNESIASIIESFLNWKIPEGSGLGVKLRVLAYIFMLPMMLNVSKNDERFLFFFRLFFFGIVGEFISSLNMNLSRIFMYFTFSQLYTIPMTVKNINKKNIVNISTILFMLGLFILFALFIINSFKGINNTLYYFSDIDFSFKEVYW